MSTASSESAAVQAIIRIIRDQKALEQHQRATRASVETLQDSMVYAYDQIVKVINAFLYNSQ